MTGSERRGGSAGELAVLGLLTALLFGGKLALAWLPNVEPVSLLVIVYTAVLGWRALLPLYAYVLLEVVTWGLNLWSVCYVYVWLILAGAAWLLRRMESPLGWAALSGGFGLAFGARCAPGFQLSGGGAVARSWWVAGLPSFIIHSGGTLCMAQVLFRPLRSLLERLAGRAGLR